MKRKIYDSLLNWKKKEGKTALLLEGARRVGKSYIVTDFAKNEYKSYILIDFNIADIFVKDLFNYDLNDLDSFFLKLETYFGVKLYNRESLIIFDEVQLFPRARSAIKYLVQDRRYDYIETGSLLSIKENVKDILLPSEEESIKMYPMDEEEFFIALGKEDIYENLRYCFEKKKALGEALHRKMMTLYREYMIVGGMPQSVNSFINTNDFKKVEEEKRLILNLYKNDIQKISSKKEEVKAIFEEIPSQLKNKERHFKLSSLEKGARFKGYKEALFWLSDSMICNFCYCSTEPNIGLKLNINNSLLKCFFADTGLLVSHSFDEKEMESEQVVKKLLFNKLECNLGMITENMVSQMLTSSGHKLYFYSSSSRENAEDRMEIDFLISKKEVTNRHNISALEVKSGKNYTLSSLKKFKKKYGEYVSSLCVLHDGDYKNEDGVEYVPLYMVPFL